jgi:hypothetical protein
MICRGLGAGHGPGSLTGYHLVPMHLRDIVPMHLRDPRSEAQGKYRRRLFQHRDALKHLTEGLISVVI